MTAAILLCSYYVLVYLFTIDTGNSYIYIHIYGEALDWLTINTILYIYNIISNIHILCTHTHCIIKLYIEKENVTRFGKRYISAQLLILCVVLGISVNF